VQVSRRLLFVLGRLLVRDNLVRYESINFGGGGFPVSILALTEEGERFMAR